MTQQICRTLSLKMYRADNGGQLCRYVASVKNSVPLFRVSVEITTMKNEDPREHDLHLV